MDPSQSKALVVSEDPAVHDYLRLILEGRYAARVEFVADAGQVRAVLSKPGGSAYGWIFAEYRGAGAEIARFRLSIPGQRAYAFWAAVKPLREELPTGTTLDDLVTGPFATDEIHRHIDANGGLPKISREAAVQEYCRIKTPFLLSVVPLCGDVYIKLSDRKFVKIFHRGDVFEDSDAKKYGETKRQEFLYLKRADAETYASRLGGRFAELVAQSQRIPPEPPVGLAAEIAANPSIAFEAVSEVCDALGFSPATQRLARLGAEMALATVKRNPDLRRVLNAMARDRGKYVSAHSFLAGHFSCLISARLEWKNDATYYKLMFAALLHDLTLRNTRMADMREPVELEKLEPRATETEKNEYLNHPIYASDVARRFKEIPPDVDFIIADHHEKPDGSGYPRKLSGSRIGPLSAVFIVGHDLADFVLDLPVGTELNKQSVMPFFEKRKYLYAQGSFKKILKIIPELQF